MFVILPVLQRLQKQVFVLASAVVLSVRPELRPANNGCDAEATSGREWNRETEMRTLWIYRLAFASVAGIIAP